MWYILNLTTQGEEEDPEVLAKALRKLFPSSEFFIPATVTYVGENRVVTKLIDNYVFVRSGLPDQAYKKAENTRYILAALMKPDRKRFESVRDEDISKMRLQLDKLTNQDIQIGDQVEILSGPYRQMVVKVFEEIPETDSVSVMVELRSKSQILTLPRDFLRLVKKSEDEKVGSSLTPYLNKLMKTRAWLAHVRLFLSSLPLRAEPVQGAIQAWLQVKSYHDRHRDLSTLLSTPQLREFNPLLSRLKEYVGYLRRFPLHFYLEVPTGHEEMLDRISSLEAQTSLMRSWVKRLQRIDGKVRELDNALSNRE